MTDKSIQIAVITNEPERAEMIDSVSTSLGWRVDANSGRMQPLNWLLAQSADVALIDLDLPHAAQLITDLTSAKPNVVVLALAMPERLVDLQSVMIAGAKDFIALPVNPSHYKAVIERAVGSTMATTAAPTLIATPTTTPASTPASTSTATHRYDNGNGEPQKAQFLDEPQPHLPPPEISAAGEAAAQVNHSQANHSQANQNQANHNHESSGTAIVKVNRPPLNGHGPALTVPALPRRIIAVVGLRGGVGRSTIAANMAMSLQQHDLGGVTLVEAHHGLSHLSLMLHLHPRNTIAGLADAMSLDMDIVRGHLQSHGSGINVLAAPSHLDDLVELSGGQWATVLETISEISPIVIVDTSATVDAALLETLVLATDIIVVMNPEIASLRATSALVNSLYTEADVQGEIHVVLNRSGVGGGLDEGTIRKQLGHDLAATLPDDAGLATYAMNRGIPFVNSHARSLLTKRVKALADKIVLGTDVPVETKRSARSLLPFLNSFG